MRLIGLACAVLVVGLNASSRPGPIPPSLLARSISANRARPNRDWERDHQTAAQLGVNVFRHWFMWASIETSPGQYDWRDYDRMVELEARNRIKVVIAEIISAGAPEWMWDKYPQARHIAADGSETFPAVNSGSATSSAPLCLDNEDVRGRAEKFPDRAGNALSRQPRHFGLRRVERGRSATVLLPGHPGQVREWLKAKYGTIEALGRAWHRYSFATWEAVHPPHGTGGYPDSLDWLAFCRDDAIRLLRWRTELIRRSTSETRSPRTAPAPSPRSSGARRPAWIPMATPGWLHAMATVPWMQFQAADLVRGASRGKPFWHAEATGGPLWMQPQVVNRPLEDGRSSDDKDVRVWSLIDMAAALRHPLHALASAARRAVIRSVRAHGDGWLGHPASGDGRPVGSLDQLARGDLEVAPGEGRRGDRLRAGVRGFQLRPGRRAGAYSQSVQGAYQAFFDSNIQADFVSIDDIGEYPLIYLPFPRCSRSPPRKSSAPMSPRAAGW